MEHRYFAASNSAEGFKNYYPEVFSRADRIYVIKGGPGTGKSSFMKRCADKALSRDYICEYYYCSSDPSSLDGVLIVGEDETVGILDGTSPHVYEPINPGAREEIVNLGQFWNSELLRIQKKEIFALAGKKSAAYKRAYSYLRSCGNLRAVTDSLLQKVISKKKLCDTAKRIAQGLSLPHGEAEVIPSLLSAVGMTGYERLDSFEKRAETVFHVGDFYGVGSLFLDELFKSLLYSRISMRVSYDPVVASHIDGIFIENSRTAFVISSGKDSDGEGEKTVNPRRFILTEQMREIRGELRYAARLYDECKIGAIHALGEAKIYHFLLEDIYKKTMNFSDLGKYTDEFMKNELNLK